MCYLVWCGKYKLSIQKWHFWKSIYMVWYVYNDMLSNCVKSVSFSPQSAEYWGWGRGERPGPSPAATVGQSCPHPASRATAIVHNNTISTASTANYHCIFVTKICNNFAGYNITALVRLLWTCRQGLRLSVVIDTILGVPKVRIHFVFCYFVSFYLSKS